MPCSLLPLFLNNEETITFTLISDFLPSLKDCEKQLTFQFPIETRVAITYECLKMKLF